MNDTHQKRLDKENKYCRYSDIRTYKDNKVEIKSDNGYINASWIHIPHYRSFIATQGPLESTIEDFWVMCYTYDVKIIVMLCKLDENYKEKCANYWDTNIKMFKIEKSCETMQLNDGLRMRKFKIINKDNGIEKNIEAFGNKYNYDKVEYIDYKDVSKLQRFTSERAKILPRRVTGTCAKHQRELTTAIKRARQIAILPYTAD